MFKQLLRIVQLNSFLGICQKIYMYLYKVIGSIAVLKTRTTIPTLDDGKYKYICVSI